MCRPIIDFPQPREEESIAGLATRTGQMLEQLASDVSGLVTYYLVRRRRS